MLTAHAFYRRAVERGAQFRSKSASPVSCVGAGWCGRATDKGGYATETVVNAAGPWRKP